MSIERQKEADMADKANKVSGRVVRLYVRDNGTNVRLEIPTEKQPLENYFLLELSHPNYNALYSLALSAAINGYVLLIRTKADIDPNAVATVEYMLVDWVNG